MMIMLHFTIVAKSVNEERCKCCSYYKTKEKKKKEHNPVQNFDVRAPLAFLSQKEGEWAL